MLFRETKRKLLWTRSTAPGPAPRVEPLVSRVRLLACGFNANQSQHLHGIFDWLQANERSHGSRAVFQRNARTKVLLQDRSNTASLCKCGKIGSGNQRRGCHFPSACMLFKGADQKMPSMLLQVFGTKTQQNSAQSALEGSATEGAVFVSLQMDGRHMPATTHTIDYWLAGWMVAISTKRFGILRCCLVQLPCPVALSSCIV